jgi:hypothetical protein
MVWQSLHFPFTPASSGAAEKNREQEIHTKRREKKKMPPSVDAGGKGGGVTNKLCLFLFLFIAKSMLKFLIISPYDK